MPFLVQSRGDQLIMITVAVLWQPVVNGKELSNIFSLSGPVIYTNGGPLVIEWMVLIR